ncbi:hypothetical protein AB4059_15025 [Lysobacter sp. 2RAF19]
MDYFKDLEPAQREVQAEWCVSRWEQLYRLNREATADAFRYLFLVNAGGAVAVLGFIGSSEEARSSGSIRAALVVFAIGILLVGVLKTLFFHQTLTLVQGWSADTKLYFSSAISESELDSRDNARAAAPIYRAQYIAGYAAFACFLLGLTLGAVALFS